MDTQQLPAQMAPCLSVSCSPGWPQPSYVAKDNLNFLLPVSASPCWGNRHASQVCTVLGAESPAFCMPGKPSTHSATALTPVHLVLRQCHCSTQASHPLVVFSSQPPHRRDHRHNGGTSPGFFPNLQSRFQVMGVTTAQPETVP